MKSGLVTLAILVVSAVAIGAPGKDAIAATRTLALHARYSGTFVCYASTGLCRQLGSTGSASVLGKSVLTMFDEARHSYGQASNCTAAEGHGALTGRRESLAFVYAIRYCNSAHYLVTGYFLIYRGTGGLAGASGGGSLRITGAGDSGKDYLDGSVSLRP